jgi:uncharacterized repeat protein (TIGR01451 family)
MNNLFKNLSARVREKTKLNPVAHHSTKKQTVSTVQSFLSQRKKHRSVCQNPKIFIGLILAVPIATLIAQGFYAPARGQSTPAYCSNLYALDSGSTSSRISTVNVTTGVYTRASTSDTLFATAAAAVQTSTGRVFYISRTTTNTRTAYWDPATNTHTQLSSSFNAGNTAVRAAFSPSGRLFVATTTTLYEINPTTGAQIGTPKDLAANGVQDDNPSGGGNGDMAFDGNGVLWLVSDSYLYTLDVDNFSPTSPAKLVAQAPGAVYNSLAFLPDGKLYTFSSSDSGLYEINTNNGARTRIATISFSPSASLFGTDFASCGSPTPSLQPTKTFAKVSGSVGSAILPGDVVEYTVTITNTGNLPATGATFRDPTPAGTTYIAGSTTMNGTAVTDGSGGTFPFATAAAIRSPGLQSGVVGIGATYAVTLKYRVSINTVSPPTSVTNQGTIFYLGSSPGGVTTDDPNNPNPNDPTVITIGGSTPDLTISKSDRDATFTQGYSGSYFLTPRNNGTIATIGQITVTDTLPPELTYVSASGTGWTCNYNSTTRVVTCTSNTVINPNSNGNQILLVVTASSGAGTTITNTANIVGGGDNTSSSGSDTTPIVALSGSVPTPIDPTPIPDVCRIPNAIDFYQVDWATGIHTSGSTYPFFSDDLFTYSNNITYTLQSGSFLTGPTRYSATHPFTSAAGPLSNSTIAYQDYNFVGVNNAVDGVVNYTFSTPLTASAGILVTDVDNGKDIELRFYDAGGNLLNTTNWQASQIRGAASETPVVTNNTNYFRMNSRALANRQDVTWLFLPPIGQNIARVEVTQINPSFSGSYAITFVHAACPPPNLLLVKRITAIDENRTTNPNDGTSLNQFVDGGTGSDDDNDPNWPTPNTYLRGAINGGRIKPSEIVEYTIYFLNTDNSARSVTVCDVVPDDQTFIPTGYNTAVPRPLESGAAPSNDTGIALGFSSTGLPTEPTLYLTNTNDSDRGRYYPPGDPLTPASCQRFDALGNLIASGAAANTNGAVVVNLVTGTTPLPPATAPGNPPDSYGFIRFRARVQ